MNLLLFGCGYLGRRVADAWRELGGKVSVVTRSAEKAEHFAAAGLAPIIADITKRGSLARLPESDVALFTVGFDRTTGQEIHEVYVDGLRNVLDALDELSPRRITYISSTGVYAQGGGQWVDEHSICQPRREGGKACLAAERLLAEHRSGRRSVSLRMAGIYGPDRIPLATAIRAGEPISAAADGYLNLIHVEDAARIAIEIAQRGATENLYCVSDGQPAVRREYYEYLANLLDAPPPRFAAPAPGSPAAARAESDKRVSNARLVAELSFDFAYPSYREGLADIVAKM